MLFRSQDKMKKGSAQIFFWGWQADYPDAENFLFLLYGPNAKALTDGNGENAANYQNPEFDRLFDRMKFLGDGPEKQALIDQMVEITQQDGVWGFGYWPKSAAAYHQWIYNGKPQHHIIDPRTSRPAVTDIMTATVIAPNACEAEVAAKVAFILGSTVGRDWVEAHDGVAALFVLENGKVIRSNRFMQYSWQASAGE